MLNSIINLSVALSAITAILSAAAAFYSLKVSRDVARRLQSKEGPLPISPDVEAGGIDAAIDADRDEP